MPSLGPTAVLLAWTTAAAQANPGPDRAAVDNSALFAASVAAGADSPAGCELRRRPAASVPLLLEALANPGTEAARERAIEHLMRLGAGAEPALPGLLALLDGSHRECIFAIVALGEIAPFVTAAARATIADSLLACRQRRPGEPGIDLQVGRAWSRTQAPATRDLAQLQLLLHSDNPFLVEVACQHLCELGPAARAALPAIAELIRRPQFPVPTITPPEHPDVRLRPGGDWRPHVRDSLFAVVQLVAAEDPAGLPLLVERLPAAPVAEQVRLLQQIGRLGAAAAVEMPFVIACAQRALPVAREAATTLAMIGGDSRAARAALQRLAEHPDAQLRARARAALRQLGPAPSR